ncbi:RNA 2'-phosphotransferase [Asaia spathodeae]|uniref:Probable RNA 2'-phosphotransferase n=1 Tax=Asaia spathodeae TaxID=657016 RepID=A0ABX2P147_9PROT|nr:RNA 2'-phosphotransferase [Asaia spathodeae]GBR13865.1 phosphate acetyltransferase [Asaia spathodeae NBRC 105894]
MKDNQVSRLLSLVLRHEPGKIGIVLDNQGWTDIADLLRLANNAGYVFDRDTLFRVVATSDKQRFTISPDGKLIRAAQGHSVQVDLNLPVSQPPARLWHGTAHKNIESILREGLNPGRRQMVHLSSDVDTAKRVGARHGEAIVLIVDTASMYEEGMAFYQAENGVWLVASVPAAYLAVEE